MIHLITSWRPYYLILIMFMTLTHQFLIAMPSMQDPNFSRSLIYICEHNDQGTVGIIVNRPLAIQLADVLQSMDIEPRSEHVNEIPLLFGGPIQQEKGFVIHHSDTEWRSSLKLAEGVVITTSQDILQSIAKGEGPEEALVALGYASWSAHQLEQEIANNMWLSCPLDQNILFRTPFADRWNAAAALISVNINMMSGDVGHA